jgi:ABC-2 type transport system permease protein
MIRSRIISDIYWVFWRDMKKFVQQKARIFMAIIQPLVWLVLMGNTMSGLTRNPMAAKMLGTGSYLDFMTPGIMIMTALFGGVFGGISIVWDRRLGFLNKMLSAPIHRASIPLGKLAALGLQTMAQVLLIVFIALILGVHFSTGIFGIISLLLISGLFGIIMGSISLSFAAVLTSMESLMAVTNFFTMPLVFTSNAMFPTSAMPGWLRAIAHFNPLTYAVGTMRSIATEGFIWANVWLGILILIIIAAITISISIRVFYRSVS